MLRAGLSSQHEYNLQCVRVVKSCQADVRSLKIEGIYMSLSVNTVDLQSPSMQLIWNCPKSDA